MRGKVVFDRAKNYKESVLNFVVMEAFVVEKTTKREIISLMDVMALLVEKIDMYA